MNKIIKGILFATFLIFGFLAISYITYIHSMSKIELLVITLASFIFYIFITEIFIPALQDVGILEKKSSQNNTGEKK